MIVSESDTSSGEYHLPITEGAFEYCRQRLRSFESIAAFVLKHPRVPPTTLATSGDVITVVSVTPELFQILEVGPYRGRLFTHSETERGAKLVAVLSYEFWERQLHSEDIIGKTIVVNRLGLRTMILVVGIMPPEFKFPYPLFSAADVWLCLRYDHRRFVEGNHFEVIAKLKTQSSPEEGQLEVRDLAQEIRIEHPREYSARGLMATPLRLKCMRGGEKVIRAFVGLLLLMLVMSGFALKYWGSRVPANEAVRRATNAPKHWEAFRVGIVECGMIALCGSVIGFVIARASGSMFYHVLPPHLRYDGDVFANCLPAVVFTVVTSVGSATTMLLGRVTSNSVKS